MVFKVTKKMLKEAAAQDKAEVAKFEALAKKYPLPEGVEISDLFESHVWWDRNDTYATLNEVPEGDYHAERISKFELWHVNDWKWCIPTLFIAKAKSGSSMMDRTYAVQINNGHQVRIGHGPHIQVTLKVHVRKDNVVRLRDKFLKLIMDGKIGANETRDIISTRRAAGARRNRFW